MALAGELRDDDLVVAIRDIRELEREGRLPGALPGPTKKEPKKKG